MQLVLLQVKMQKEKDFPLLSAKRGSKDIQHKPQVAFLNEEQASATMSHAYYMHIHPQPTPG